MGAIDRLRDARAEHNPLIPLALGIVAHARPLLEALRATAPSPPAPRPGDALRHAVLGYLALALRVEALIDREVSASPPDPSPPAPSPRESLLR